jgi:hypothetical protein
MKLPILLLFILLTLASCGEKKDSGKATFKLMLGQSIDAEVVYAGGVLIMGRHESGEHSFVLKYTAGLAIDLPKGVWEFAAIGWDSSANGPMTGNHRCSYARNELRDDNQTIGFNMSLNQCIYARTLLGERFSDSQFLNLPNASSTGGFKKLGMNFCQTIDTLNKVCNYSSASSTTRAVRVELIPDIRGVNVNSVSGLASQCMVVSSGYLSSDLKIPLGGEQGFIKSVVRTFTDTNCTNLNKVFVFNHGLAEKLPMMAMMSPNNDMDMSYSFLGNYNNAVPPFLRAFHKGETYYATVAISTPLNTPAGTLIFYNGSSWQAGYINGLELGLDNNLYNIHPTAFLFLKD